MKKPRKKYSAERNYARAARHIVKDLVISFSIGNSPLVFNIRTNKKVALTETLYRAFHTINHQWTVYTAVMLTNSMDEKYVSINECSPSHPCYKEQMTESINESHVKHIQSTKKQDRVNTGWVACVGEKELSEQKIVELLELHKDCWTRHERGQVLTDDELTTDQKLKNELERVE